MPGPHRPAAAVLLAASVAIPPLAALLAFERPASTFSEASALARPGVMLAHSRQVPGGSAVPDSIAGWAGFRLPEELVSEPVTCGASSALFPYRIAAFSFPPDSSVMILVSSPVPLELGSSGPDAPSVRPLGARAAILVVPGSAGSGASLTAEGVELL